MNISYRTEIVQNVTLTQIAVNPALRDQLNKALNVYGQQGWKAYHVEQVGNDLVVFFFAED